ncbi:hypothetical protein CRUP_021658 [Coryphaenoides rupestris]|nr:hypothetical protein CRUP_021658 [Coryphaenoides rupestris]
MCCDERRCGGRARDVAAALAVALAAAAASSASDCCPHILGAQGPLAWSCVVHFFVPIAVVTFCYLRIWILVIQVRRKVKSEVRPRIKPSDMRNFITMFVVFVLFAICWAPLNFIGLAVSIDPAAVPPHIPEWLFVVSYFMAYFNSCLNAIIYGLLNQNFRKEYKRIVMSVWKPRLFFQETSRGGTEAMKSKPSPGLNNNDQVKGQTV